MPQESYQGIRAETRRMIDGWEGVNVEFKRQASGVDPEDLVAFANASGGTILVGVDEVDRRGQCGVVVGCEVSDQTRSAIMSNAQNCNPPVPIDITIENMGSEARRIIRIDIPEGQHKPYGTERGTYKIRVEGQNAGMRPDMLLAMFLEREQETFIGRFREAAQTVVTQLQEMEERIADRLRRIERRSGGAE